jgi:hypothetical protein
MRLSSVAALHSDRERFRRQKPADTSQMDFLALKGLSGEI